MVLPALMLQKPSAKSKAKDHRARMEKRMDAWRKGDLLFLLKEVRVIQKRLITGKRRNVCTSKKFAELIFEGKTNAALRMSKGAMDSGPLDITPDVLKGLQEKHPRVSSVPEGSLLLGPIDRISETEFDFLDEKAIMRSAMNTKGTAGPSGMDADVWRKILCSNNFKTAGKELREEIAILGKTFRQKVLIANY